jgi:hypothetical protein
VSNSPPTAQEAAAATAAVADFASAAASAAQALQSVKSMKQRQERGRPALAGAKPWGVSRSHRVSVLLRSGVSAPTWPPQSESSSPVASAPASATTRVKEVDTGTDTSAYYKVCLDAEGEGSVGLGPSRIPERWRGGFTYLLVAPQTAPLVQAGAAATASAPASDAAVAASKLALLECQARAEDMAEPEATALRGIRELFGEWVDEAELTQAALDRAIIEHREILKADGEAIASVRAATPRYPPLPPPAELPAVAATAGSSAGGSASSSAVSAAASDAGSEACPLPTGPFGRSFEAGSHLFVIDLDVLVRCGAIGGGWGVAGGTVEAVRRLQLQGKTEAAPNDETAAEPGSAAAKRGRGGNPGSKPASVRVELVGEGAMLSLLPPAATAISAAAVPRAVAASTEDDPSSGAAGDMPATILRVPVSVVRSMSTEQLAAPRWWRDTSLAEACAAACGSHPSHPAPAPAPSGTSHGWAAPSLRSLLRAWQGVSEPCFPQRRERRIRLFHGTGPGLAARVLREGFRRPTCKLNPACLKALEQARTGASGSAVAAAASPKQDDADAEPALFTADEALPLTIPHGCDCQMMGFAVYLARKRKAFSYASRRAEPDEQGSSTGAVIECEVDLGRCRHAQRVPCACGCKKPYCDHFGTWYSQQGCDSVFVDDHSRPATSTAEWAVADPARVHPVAIILFQTA